jgi:hypothetical protein
MLREFLASEETRKTRDQGATGMVRDRKDAVESERQEVEDAQATDKSTMQRMRDGLGGKVFLLASAECLFRFIGRISRYT